MLNPMDQTQVHMHTPHYINSYYEKVEKPIAKLYSKREIWVRKAIQKNLEYENTHGRALQSMS